MVAAFLTVGSVLDTCATADGDDLDPAVEAIPASRVVDVNVTLLALVLQPMGRDETRIARLELEVG